MPNFNNTKAHALQLDAQDPLAYLRAQFHIPQTPTEEDILYFCGHSLGLQPKATQSYVGQVLEDWAKYGVAGHFHGEHPWLNYHELVAQPLADLVGAKMQEVVAMNSLTLNLHLGMVSFYRPHKQRYKILIEAGAFPSDQYAIVSQLHYHGLDPNDALVIIDANPTEHRISQQHILDIIEQQGCEIALILLPGVAFRSGQVFDIAKITAAGHAKGCQVGFDLAHAIGNVPLDLHAWQVDFAVWCSYKYLNAGPGAIAGMFIHTNHLQARELPRLAGWWGHNKATRFAMPVEFDPMPTAEGWQLSNPPILQLAALRASLAIFNAVGLQKLRAKSQLLTAYLAFLLQQLPSEQVEIITPSDPAQRGSQLSLQVAFAIADPIAAFKQQGIYCDYRQPNIMRVAPTASYNQFIEVYTFVEKLKEFLPM